MKDEGNAPLSNLNKSRFSVVVFQRTTLCKQARHDEFYMVLTHGWASFSFTFSLTPSLS